MKNLLEYFQDVEAVVVGKNIFLFLDYDGTLVPIAQKPQDAVLSSQTKDQLASLSSIISCRVAIISGRSVENVAAMVGLKRLIYAGNHGLEVRADEMGLKTFVFDEHKEVMKEARDAVIEACSRLSGVLIEDKGLTFSLHYRMSPEEDVPQIKAIFREVIRKFMKDSMIRVVEGKKVFEVRPAIDWDKGKVVKWLLEQDLFKDGKQVVPIYIGDDTTDEDALRILAGKGLTVWVGPGQRMETDYHCEDTAEVLRFLGNLWELLLKR